MITADLPDERLVEAARSGDRHALDTLLRRHYDRIHAVCTRIAGAQRDGDDAAQEALLRIVRSLDRFDGRSSFGTWAYRIATNAALDELRRRGRRPSLHVVGDRDDPIPEVADELAHRHVEAIVDRQTVAAALATLPEEFRSALVMREVAELDYHEIAAALDVPLGTVKSRIARARRLMIDAVGNQTPLSRRPTIDIGQPTSDAELDDPPSHP